MILKNMQEIVLNFQKNIKMYRLVDIGNNLKGFFRMYKIKDEI